MILECGGVLRLDPRPFSLRQLLIMREASALDDWDHTAYICWQLSAPYSKRRMRFDEFHPLRKQIQPVQPNARFKSTHAAMKALLKGKQKRNGQLPNV